MDLPDPVREYYDIQVIFLAACAEHAITLWTIGLAAAA